MKKTHHENHTSMNKSEFLFKAPVGILKAVYAQEKLEELFIANMNPGELKLTSARNGFEKLICSEITSYFKGDLKRFSIPVNPRGTAFQEKVWKLLEKIPYGETVTYSELALQVESEKYRRAVAGAVKRNPVFIIIPCHRVVASNGIGGFYYGPEMKQFLLKIEAGK